MPASSLPEFFQLKSSNPDLSALTTRLQEIFRAYGSKEIVDGNLLKDVVLTITITNSISHKLGRPCNGYIVVKNSTQSTIWDLESTNTQKSSFLNLRTSATTTVSLWVF